MLFELGHVPMPEGYGDGILALEDCKAHLRVRSDDEDLLIAALRDAAIEFVERYCEVKLGPVEGLTWRAQSLPSGVGEVVNLTLRPVTEITSIEWRDASGGEVIGDVDAFRVSEGGRLQPVIGGSWPADVGGEVVITFAAGYAEGAAPQSLLSAIKLLLGHLYMQREELVGGTISGDAPFGLVVLCAPFRRVMV